MTPTKEMIEAQMLEALIVAEKELSGRRGKYGLGVVREALKAYRAQLDKPVSAPQEELRAAIDLAKEQPLTMTWQKTLIEAAQAYLDSMGDDGWRDIESAPRDVPILVIDVDDIGKEQGGISDDEGYCCAVVGVFSKYWGSDKPVWVDAYDKYFNIGNPTHWRPLPQPPKGE